MKIYKYELSNVGQTYEYMLPHGSKPLGVVNQDEHVRFYVLHGAGEEELRRFIALPTGNLDSLDVPKLGAFVGTVTLRGWFVAHVFEVLPD